METRTLDLMPRTGCGEHSLHSLRRYLAGEFDAECQAQIEDHLDSCLDCASLVAEMHSDKAAFEAVMPFERFAADFEARLEQNAGWLPRLTALRWPALGTAVAAAAAVMLLTIGPVEDPGLRTKGADPAGIGFLIKDGSEVRRGSEGELLGRGAQIQFLVKPAPESRSMVLLGIDGRGAVTVYTAETLAHQTKGPDSLKPLQGSVILDDAVGPERFFAVFSTGQDPEQLHRIAQSAALQLAQQGADLRQVESLPLEDAELVQTSISIIKVEP